MIQKFEGSPSTAGRRPGVVTLDTRGSEPLKAVAPGSKHPHEWPLRSSRPAYLIRAWERASRVPLGFEDRPEQSAGLPLFDALYVAALFLGVGAVSMAAVLLPGMVAR